MVESVETRNAWSTRDMSVQSRVVFNISLNVCILGGDKLSASCETSDTILMAIDRQETLWGIPSHIPEHGTASRMFESLNTLE